MTSETKPSADRTEVLLRMSRRGLLVVLLMLLSCGTVILAHLLRPESLLGRWPSKAPWLIPLVIVFAAVLNAPFGKLRWRAGGAEEQAILTDEFRQANLSRAHRITLITLLVVQAPLALMLGSLDPNAAPMAMAIANITLGMVVLIASFLVLDRE